MDNGINIENIVTEGIKNKQRVKQNGEVFTPKHIVKDMCDLVDEAFDNENIDKLTRLKKTYFEPSCGTGNFLVEILDRKLKIAKELSNENEEMKWYYIFLALSTIYAVDIQKDNVEESKIRMIGVLKENIADIPNEYLKSFEYLLECNVICGNALTCKLMINSEKESTSDIVISDWVLDCKTIYKNDYLLRDMIANYDYCVNHSDELSLESLATAESSKYSDETGYDF